MSGINPNRLSKKLQKIYFNGRCRHYHFYYEHPNCFRKEILEPLRGGLKEGYLDIETTGFEADYHHILSYAIKVRGENKVYTAVVTKEELESGEFDKRVVKQLIEDLRNFAVIYTYYGTMFDWRFARARAVYWRLPFPEFGYIQHKDIYYLVRNKLKLHRNSLEAATRFLSIQGKDHVEGDIWMRARIGDKKALKYVLEHNIKDVDILEKLHDRLENYDKGTTKSI